MMKGSLSKRCQALIGYLAMNLITLFLISMPYLITANKGELFDLVYWGPKHRKVRFYCQNGHCSYNVHQHKPKRLNNWACGSTDIQKHTVRTIMKSSSTVTSNMNRSNVRWMQIIPSSHFKNICVRRTTRTRKDCCQVKDYCSFRRTVKQVI